MFQRTFVEPDIKSLLQFIWIRNAIVLPTLMQMYGFICRISILLVRIKKASSLTFIEFQLDFNHQAEIVSLNGYQNKM